MRGDYVDALPALLADRRDGAQLVVFQTASTMYPPRAVSFASGRRSSSPLGSSRSSSSAPVCTTRATRSSSSAIRAARSSGLAVFDFHGAWLEWGR